MAEVALTPVINMTVEIAANFIVRKSSRLSWLPEDMDWLQREMKHMRAYLEVVEAKQITNPQVASLVKDIRDLAQHTEDILDTFVPEIESHRSRGIIKRTANMLFYGRTCRKFAREIEKIKRRVQAIEARRNTYGIRDVDVGSDRVNVDPRIVALHVDEPFVVGLDRDIIDLKMKLLTEEKELSFLAIVGMAGMGKTTLAKIVFKGVKHRFDCFASVSVSQRPNVKDLLKDIAKQVGLGETENVEANLYAYLQEKRYVLLLDDIWDIEAWDRLKLGFPSNCVNGSRIIITSRYTDVGRYIGCERSLHPLCPLDFRTSWNLFCELIMPSLRGTIEDFEHSELGEIGKEIVKRCGGLPLAIVVTVGMLRERESGEVAWREVLKSTGQGSHDKCSQILALSYRDLPSALKPCFLYLGLFPEDYEIQVTELIRMWVAEKFIEGRQGFELEDVGEDYINKLVARNLVQVVRRKHDGRIKRIRIHDLLHSMCVNVAKKINFFHTTLDNQNSGSVTRVRRFATYGSMEGDFAHQNLDLRTLLYFKEEDWTGGRNLSNSRRLRVLSIYGSECPTKLETLIHMNYLLLDSGISIRGLGSRKNYKNLQSLDLRGVLMTRIPAGIWRMKQLRHLLWMHYQDLGMPSSLPGKVSLPNLQTLVGIYSSQIDFLGPDSFPNLRKFHVRAVTDDFVKKLCGPELISVKIRNLCLEDGATKETLDLSRYKNLTKLGIGLKLEQLPQINQFPPNLLKVDLSGNYLEEDPMQILKELPKLKILRLASNCYTGRKLDCSGANGFRQLEVLHLIGLYGLEELIDGEERAMHKLKEVNIHGCPKLRRIPKWLQRLRMTE